MSYELHRFVKVSADGKAEFRAMRRSNGDVMNQVYRFATEQAAWDATRLWDSGGSLRSDFRVVESTEPVNITL